MNREIQEALDRCYTVRQLIEILSEKDQDARVLFTCDYGDYHHTQQALPVGEVEEGESTDLADSGYSQSGIALVANEPDHHDEPRAESDDEPEDIVILR